MANGDPFEFRSIDGIGNNLLSPLKGSSGSVFLRLTPSNYADDVSSLAGPDRPSARAISNAVLAQDEDRPSSLGTSDLFWAWGQFLDHDIDLIEEAPHGSAESVPIAVPTGDPFFDPFNTGTATIDFTRSGEAPGTGTDAGNPREHVNKITAFIDASMVYGSTPEVQDLLRDEGGKLATSDDDLLPFSLDEPGHFQAGDVRANENVGLTSLHTIFVREHNRLVDELAEQHPEYDAERLYQEAKALVEAKVQSITVNEFLPLLLGDNPLGDYQGYDASIDPGIANIFAAAAYRVGHTMLSSSLMRLEENGDTGAFGNLALRDAFFRPDKILNEGGIDPILRGLAAGVSQEIDTHLVDDVRNFLFGPPGAGGFDLGSLNIQRGRDHGLPSYNEAREAYGLEAVTDFSEITSDAEIAAALAGVYGSVEKIDVFVGGLAEDHVPGAVVGELFHAVLSEQFARLRDGDRFWFENRFEGEELAALQQTTLAQVILANSDIGMIQDQAMLAYNRIGGGEDRDTMEGTWDRDLMLGEGGRDVLHGHENDDQIHGGEDRDRLFGEDGDDKLVGDAGGDFIEGGAGNDHIDAGEGRDKAKGGEGGDLIEGGDGRDRLYGEEGDDHIDAGSGRDRAYGGEGDDRIEGGEDRDMLFGGEGDDSVDGGDDDDMVFGGAGNDALFGGGGNDDLDGGDGDDTLVGGEGRDDLEGGAGADIFRYESLLELGDVIEDFNPLQDLLDLSALADSVADVSVRQMGYDTAVVATLNSGQRVMVAELELVKASELSVGLGPDDNIIF